MVSRRGKIFFNYYNSILILKFFFRYGFLFKLNMRISKLFYNNYSFLVKKIKKSRFRYFKLKRKKLLYSKKEMMLIKRPKTLKFFSQFWMVRKKDFILFRFHYIIFSKVYKHSYKDLSLRTIFTKYRYKPIFIMDKLKRKLMTNLLFSMGYYYKVSLCGGIGRHARLKI